MKAKYAVALATALGIVGCSKSDAGQNAKNAEPSKQRTVMVTKAIRKGATLCIDQKDMIKARALEMSGNPYVQMPYSCDTATFQVPAEIVGTDQFGFLIVQTSGGRGLIQQKDIENVYTEQ